MLGCTNVCNRRLARDRVYLAVLGEITRVGEG